MCYDNFCLVMRRRRHLKNCIVLIIILCVFLFIYNFLISIPTLNHHTELHKCPACYGATFCPELYSGKIILKDKTFISRYINSKNVYYGRTSNNKQIVAKKLAHAFELNKLDEILCREFNMNQNCDFKQLANDKDIINKITRLVSFDSERYGFENKLIFCPNAKAFSQVVDYLYHFSSSKKETFLVNLLTILYVNPEPLLLQLLPRSQGWPVPAYGGVCGRLMVESYNGEPLSSFLNVAYIRKLKIASQLLKAAANFTFKHDRYRFYFTDWTLDNFVVDEDDQVTFVDLEHVIMLNKQSPPESSEWSKRFIKSNKSSSSVVEVTDMCNHHLSDYNFWSACNLLGGNYSPFLYPIPSYIKHSADLDVLIRKCINSEDKFNVVDQLQQIIADIINDMKQH